MANKAISELPQAQNVNNQDLFVLEQSGIAKKLTAETFITEQGIIDALAEALDGHGGIQSVTLASVSGRIRTYRITFTDQSATTFQVYDGTSIDRISRTSSSGLDDVYTIFLSDGTTTFFTVHNGADGTVSEAMLNDALKNKAPAITETTESSAIANFTDGADDMVMHNVVAEINPVQDLTYGDPYPAGGGVNKFDESVFSNYGGVLQTSGVWHFNSLVNVLDKVIWTAPESIGQITVTMWRKQSGVGSQGLRLAINYTDGTSVKVGNQNATGGTDVYSVTTDASKTVRDITSDYGSNQNSTDVNVVVSIGSTAPSAYSPYSNICPITGHTEVNVTRTGVNIWDEEWEVGGLSTSTGAAEIDNQKIRSKNFCACKPRTTYCKVCVNPATYVWYYDIEKNFISFATSATTFTTPDNCYYFKIRVGDLSHPQTTYNHDISINYPSSDHDYHAYQGSNTVTVDWQTEAGTVYGGTIDMATGLLTVDRVINERLLSTFSSLGDLTNTTHYRYVDEFFPSGTGRAVADSTAICNIAPYAYNSTDTTHFYLSWNTQYNTNRIELWVPKGTATTTPVQICAKLREPLTYQLTGQQLMTLLGNNSVWADTGNVSVTYPADTKLYIEKLTQPTEDDMTADHAISSGTFFMLGNNLYLATAAIASGATIIEGTNATRLSLADALNRLS